MERTQVRTKKVKMQNTHEKTVVAMLTGRLPKIVELFSIFLSDHLRK
jgi:hypothetical protein